MILRQFLHKEPVAVSYFAGCGTHAAAAVIDPVGDIEPYLRVAEEAGTKLRYVIDTHLHADHISAGRALAEAAGGEYVLFADARTNFPFHAVRDGDMLEMGNTLMNVLHTPGHTPEHISLVVTDLRRGEEPWFVLTGHTLMVGDLGRTELATSAEEGARSLFQSIQKLKALPDYLEVLPGAYAGSVCGRSLSGKPMSTIGFERRHNKALSIGSEEEFRFPLVLEPAPNPRLEHVGRGRSGRGARLIRFMLADVPAAPPRAAEIRAANSGLLEAAE